MSFLCDLSGLGVRRFFPHAEDAKGAKAEAQERSGRASRRCEFVGAGPRFLS